MTGLGLTERSIGLVSTLVVARVLVPADFGPGGDGHRHTRHLDAVTAFGFEMALIR